MVNLVELSLLDKSIKSIFLIGLILLVRKQFNLKSIKWANMILWTILFAYLLIPYSFFFRIEHVEQFGWLRIFIEPILWMSESVRVIAKQLGYILSDINIMVVAALLLCYILYQILKVNRILKGSKDVVEDERITECLNMFRFRREISIYTNDKIKVPITYGFIHPKIILKTKILQDDELLKHVLIHELTHIRKFDILWNHLKYFVACIYWHNLLIWAIAKYIEEDLEMLCDKLVVQKLGDTQANRKQYCASMLKMIEQESNDNKLVLKLHPTMERMVVMKKWKSTGTGLITLVLVMSLSIGAFADVKTVETGKVVVSNNPSQSYINQDKRVRVITKEEYQALKFEKDKGIRPFKADINETVTLSGLAEKQYKFNMRSWTEPYHDGFVIELSDMSCSGGINYGVIIEEDNRVIYKRTFEKATTLTLKAFEYSKYRITIDNNSLDSLKYSIKINSYIR